MSYYVIKFNLLSVSCELVHYGDHNRFSVLWILNVTCDQDITKGWCIDTDNPGPVNITQLNHIGVSVEGARGGAVGWRAALQTGRSLEFFIDIILPARNEYQEYFVGGNGGRCVRLTTLPPSCAWNLGASTSWNPQELSRPVIWWLHVSVEFTLLVACVFVEKNLRMSVCTSIRNVRDVVLSTTLVHDRSGWCRILMWPSVHWYSIL